jgi:HSP20 family protein
MPTWDPYGELERLRREMDRVFESASPGGPRTVSFLPGAGARQYPRVTVSEVGDGYLIEAAAPGVDPATLDVSLKDNVLTLAGEKRPPQGVKAEAFHRTERAGGRFVRNIELPEEVDPDRVKASYTDGVIQVSLPRSEKAKPRRIEIAVS